MTVELAICAIVRDEEPYLAEWIDHHRHIGFTRFDLYDDYSRDNTIDVAIGSGANVTLWKERDYPPYYSPTDCEFSRTPQICAFNHWISRNSSTPDLYVAFIDPDEYLYSPIHATVQEILPFPVATRSALWVNWLFFGDNGHQTKPALSTREAYTRRGLIGQPDPYGLQGKVIARASQLSHFGPYGSHNAVYRTGWCLDEKRVMVPRAANCNPTANTWRLNHYYHRSTEEACQKLQRGDRNAVPNYIPNQARLDACNLNTVEDRDILLYVPRS